MLTYNTLSSMSGVFWKLPGCAPNSGTAFSPGDHSHAIVSCETFAGVMSVSGE